MGYTAQLTAGVWVGNDSGKPMNRATGGSLPAEIWRQVMRVAHEGLPPLLLPGTVAANPQVEAAAWGNLANRLPRVVEAPEVLPWQRSSSAGPQRFSADVATFTPPHASHPANSIDEDFIEKALATTQGDNGNRSVSATTPDRRQSGPIPFNDWW
ncbi:MAG TPA: hypothetical protein PKE16_09295 [Hyphomicrobium sp.]|nr:hypothetical protein [Hyphomicrobium sp.]